jgi:hypothetical protein
VVFISFGLFAPFNATLVSSLPVAALSFGSTLFNFGDVQALNGSVSDLQLSVSLALAHLETAEPNHVVLMQRALPPTSV